MSYTLAFTEHGGWVAVEIAGVISSAEALSQKFDAIVGSLLSMDSKRVLVDNRELDVILDAYAVSQTAGRLVDNGVPALGIRYAVLCHERIAATCRLIETSFRNSSLRFRIFFDHATAVEWLTS